ncbi:hypothetical protein CR513_04840, partial [Mucuna pruriens]
MQKIPYPSAVGSLMYLSDLGMQHWKAVKRVIQEQKDTCSLIRSLKVWRSLGYSNSDFAGCLVSKHSTYGNIYILAGGAIS